ncbi:MAG: trehalose-6-phosphate synthase [Acidimicrobiia bacterium]
MALAIESIERTGPSRTQPITDNAKLIVASYRLPSSAPTSSTGHQVGGSGGLISAVVPGVRDRDTLWIGAMTQGPKRPTTNSPLRRMVGVEVAGALHDEAYGGFANATLWPALHGALRPIRFQPSWWRAYQLVNQRFAQTIASHAPVRSLVWLHDYQLMLTASYLRSLRPDLRIGFFLHTPFPEPEIAATIPHHRELVTALTDADLLGFQDSRSLDNFMALNDDVRAERSRSARTPGARLGVFPVAADSSRFDRTARTAGSTADALAWRQRVGDPTLLLVGVDRLDYTKGITTRLHAIDRLLTAGVLCAKDMRLVQVALRTRESIPEFDRYRRDVLGLAEAINQRHEIADHRPIHIVDVPLDHSDLCALYRAADVMLVTPVRDGMNLVAKEYVASQATGTGALVLGRGAGAAQQLSSAFLVDGGNPASVAEGIIRASCAPSDERQRRMTELRNVVMQESAASWASQFLAALADDSWRERGRGRDDQRYAVC